MYDVSILPVFPVTLCFQLFFLVFFILIFSHCFLTSEMLCPVFYAHWTDFSIWKSQMSFPQRSLSESTAYPKLYLTFVNLYYKPVSEFKACYNLIS